MLQKTEKNKSDDLQQNCLTLELSGWPPKLAASAPPRFFQSAEVTGWASLYLSLPPPFLERGDIRPN
jgi:hypothetical protein